MSWPGRKSEDGRAAASSSVANSQNGARSSSHTTTASAGGGGGIFSFLKTELDSFVKGLSGKADLGESAAKPTPNPSRKKLKRSHEPRHDQPSYAELKAYERELDEIRQHTSKRFTDQDYYAPLTEANLQASTSRLQNMDPSPSTSISRDRRSQETRELVDAYSSYYIDEPVPPVPSPYIAHHNASASESVEKRRRKRERAATFINDEEARQAVARQIAEEEARLKAAEARAIEHRRNREREARELKRRQDRADALARLEAQQLQEDAEARRRAEGQRQAAEQEERDRVEKARRAAEERRQQEEVDERRRVDRKRRRQQQLEAEAKRQKERAEQEERARLMEEGRRKRQEQEEADRAGEEQAYRLRQQQRENARRTRDLEHAEQERIQAIKDASESTRIRELEAEVQRLRQELEEAKRKQEEAAALSASTSRHVHFAPTPPASDGQRGETSFLSMNSASTTSLSSLSRAPPPAPPPPPPPPAASGSNVAGTKAARASPLALLAAHRASAKAGEGASTSKKRPSGINAAIGMPADMGKFLSEMKNTKLRKVGMPVEGAKKPKDEEETGLKSILEGVLKKRFLGDKDRSSGSTRTSSIPTLSNNSQTSVSTGDDSLTSFSSYRPPDWSMEMDSSPFPPVRSTSLRRPQDAAAGAAHKFSRIPVASTSATTGSRILPRALSQPQLAESSQTERESSVSGLSRSQSLAKVHPRPQTSFGHAVTCEEPAAPTRQKTQVYVSGHHRQSSQSTPLQRPLSEFLKHRRDLTGMTEPPTAATVRTRQSSDQTTTGRSVRSVGSSFDIELYTQMQLQEDNDSLEEEMRRSFSNPPTVDGTMDFASRVARPPAIKRSGAEVAKKSKSPAGIPEFTFRQPAFTFSPEAVLPAPTSRPPLESGGRKVSYYTHPRAAPLPPTDQKEMSPEKYAARTDANGRPLSPSKSRARLKASRAPLQSLSSHTLDDEDESILLPYLTEEQADVLLAEDENTISGYGQRIS
ncbi:hypothetical protein P389DRAFT_53501 [Cystobasidium minutum MCA 4210]|uniref:uncharacterized protein n=1 Tax=Cystobasidium minutum MCA 4210 TaxID=1397322 RepID=UPI0034CD7F96|eukprot:jgi/Rhomi1/53501/CE53500_307